MSIAITIKCLEGIVLASDTRVSLEVRNNNYVFYNHFDGAKKLFSLGGVHNHIGILTYGLVSLKNRAVHNFIPELLLDLGEKRLLSVMDYAIKISDFFQKKWEKIMPIDYNGQEMAFVVCGFDKLEPYGKVFTFRLPYHADPKPNMEGDNNFGITYGGDGNFVNRLIYGFDPMLVENIKKNPNIDQSTKDELLKDITNKYRTQMPFDIYSLQDAVDLARTLISATIDMKRLSIGPDVVGGKIEIAVIKRDSDIEFVTKRELV